MTTTRHSRLGSLIASGVVAVAAMTSLAPAANAQTEQQIKAGCDQASGTYESTGVVPDNGHTYSACCYNDYKGKRWCDSYTDGTYTMTNPATVKKPPPGPVTGSTPPVAPPISESPPAANANE